MIASVQAMYEGTKDHVEAAVHLREDDGTSVHRLIDTASVTLMHNQHDMVTIKFDKNAYHKEFEKFFIFFIHPPIQRHMQIRLNVKLGDGRVATDRQSVRAAELLINPDQLQNPALAGRQQTDFTGEPGFELISPSRST